MNCNSKDDFEIIDELGKGGFGVVFKVETKHDRAVYVLKEVNLSTLKKRHGHDSKLIEMNRKEHRNITPHANIVQVFNNFEGCLFFIF